ncbi:MAG: hypothetical protein AAGA08_01335 [Pseudomonadota bacterium]
MIGIGDITTQGVAAAPSLFGGNVLSTRNELNTADGYAGAIDDLGVTNLRFPGGSLTEYYFDITDPDSDTGVHSETGQIKSLIPLSDFMAFAQENGHAVTLVLPSRHYISDESDENGDRFAEVDEEALRSYIRDVASGAYGTAEISAFEIGNEYWHSGDMSAVEYGRVAADMVRIVDQELSAVAQDNPAAESIDVLVQIGQNDGTGVLNGLVDGDSSTEIVEAFETRYDLDLDGDAIYRGGGVNYANIANEMIIAELENDGAMGAVDGVIAHIYSQGAEFEGSRTFLLDQIEATWREDYPTLETYVTEWNLKGSTDFLEEDEDFGLFQAAEMLNIVEEFLTYDVTSANVWPLIQVTDNALSTTGVYGETNAPGGMFRWMAENLPGMTLLDLNPNSARKTEAEFEDMSVHGFADESDLLFYVVGEHEEGVSSTNLDISELVADYGTIEIQILGVEDGAKTGSNESAAFIETVDAADAVEDSVIDVNLDPGEIAQIIVRDYTFSSAYADILSPSQRSDGQTADETVPPPEVEEEAEDSGSGSAFDWVLALLPLAGLMGAG